MNIRENLVNYLYDKDYIISLYDDYVYIFNYQYLDMFSDTKVVVRLLNKTIKINGNKLLIVKITKEELLIRGSIKNLEMTGKDEQN
jgi:sporulation protein YqfC